MVLKHMMLPHSRICLALMLGMALLASSPANAAPKKPSGSTVYRQQCAKCHGSKGQGVKGKYDDELVGDWPIDKLIRYITKAMPDEHPEKCVGEEAVAVSQWMYDAFYSQEARLRNKPVRIDLVHLTNRQYVNTVADLLKESTGRDDVKVTEHGLRGTYYNSRGFGKKAFDRLDPHVSFDFAQGSPDEKIGKDEFSMRWAGSIIAEENGDYEFYVKTPLGTRLWVNDDEQPLIDAWVSSGQQEHQATIRLIGGRVYPLMLDCFKFKDKSASISLEWKTPHGVRQIIPARNLTTARSSQTYVVSTPFPPDDSSIGYARGVGVSKEWDEATTQAALGVAAHVSKNLNRLARSRSSDSDHAAKVEAFCQRFVEAAFRRPITSAEKHNYVTAMLSSTPKVEEAVKRVVLVTLKSPYFIYLGLKDSRPDAFEVASRLSYAMWDSLPDAELRKAAAEGRLQTREQISQQASRMLRDPRSKAKMHYFLEQWLQVNHVEDLSKDPALFPGFSPQIIADLRTSLNLFLDETIWGETSNYRDLLLSDSFYVNKRLADYYGVKADAPEDDFVKVRLEPSQRAGVITHPFLLSAFSYPRSTSPIHRGVFLTRNIVGRSLRPPPMAIAFKDAEFAPNMTMREKIAELTRPSACQSCHSVINPLGFSLEHYDAVGRFRTKDGNRPVDAVGEYTTDEGDTVKFQKARDLAAFAAGSEVAHNAFVQQLFQQVVKQPMLAYGPKMLDEIRKNFADSGYNVQKLFANIATVAASRGLHGSDTAKTATK